MEFPNLFIDSLGESKIRYHVPMPYSRKSTREDRKKRHRALIGHYLIMSNGISSKKKVFLQNENFNKKNQYWSEFIINAKAFSSLEEAEEIMKSYRYNNPCVIKVIDSQYYKIVSRGGIP